MQRRGNGLLSASPAPVRHAATAAASAASANAPRGLSLRPTLPERNVTRATIEEAYVKFIFYCNPAVSLDTDPTELREAFLTPPKSGGKTFSTFTLFELIRKLETKELKTWAELALSLGVEPPDQDKGQSSQKIQQYAVRLKRWMHSMHVDAFFEYLLGNEHPYWTQIPSDPNPVSEILRDGVAAEDDMALRALLPQIRPKRGRRRPDDDDTTKSPSQRPRLEASPLNDEFSGLRQDTTLGPWSAHPDGRNFVFAQTTPIGVQPTSSPWTNDLSQTPLSAYPRSAITPSTRQTFWVDEPKSAIGPPKPMKRRHGAKVVSSAWRSGGPGGTGKTRGRPPMNRSLNDGPFSAFPTDAPSAFRASPGDMTPLPPGLAADVDLTVDAIVSVPPVPHTIPPPSINSSNNNPTPPPPPPPPPPDLTPTSAGPRPPKPGRLSLQVPQRVGGEVRLATPPPVVMVNGQATPTTHDDDDDDDDDVDDMGIPQPLMTDFDLPTIDILNGRNLPTGAAATANASFATNAGPFSGSGTNILGGPAVAATAAAAATQHVRIQDPTDRTNMDDLESFFIHEILTANWINAAGQPIAPCGIDEAQGITSIVIENLLKTATSKETFLINLAALAGGKILKSPTFLRITRIECAADYNRYLCEWELRFGDIRGQFSMRETLPHHKWKRPPPPPSPPLQPPPPTVGAATAAATPDRAGGRSGGGMGGDASALGGGEEGGEGPGAAGPPSAEHWHRKYTELLERFVRKDQELDSLRYRVVDATKDPKLRPLG